MAHDKPLFFGGLIINTNSYQTKKNWHVILLTDSEAVKSYQTKKNWHVILLTDSEAVKS